jgi:hypothetical protein
MIDEVQKRFAHSLNGRLDVGLDEIGVRKTHVSRVVELRRWDGAGFEGGPKGAIFPREFVWLHRLPRPLPVSQFGRRVGGVAIAQVSVGTAH